MRQTDFARSRGRFLSSVGCTERLLYTPEMQSDGVIKLVVNGKQDIQEYIQSYYESTTLEAILTRFSNGDMSALNKYQPIYADISNAPHSLAEALQTINNSRSAFDALPVEVKRHFDNDFNRWLASAGSEEWFAGMASIFPSSDSSQEERNSAPAPSPDV